MMEYIDYLADGLVTSSHHVVFALAWLNTEAPIGMSGFAFLFGAAMMGWFGTYVYRLPIKHGISLRDAGEEKTHGDFVSIPETRQVCVCDHCRTPIGWRSQAPIVGWLWTMGKCPSCGKRASVAYPILEFLGGVLSAVVFSQTGSLIVLIAMFFLIFIAWLDWKTEWIPDFLTIPFTLLGLTVAALGLSPVTFSHSYLGVIFCAGFWAAGEIIAVGFRAFRLWYHGEKGQACELIRSASSMMSVGDIMLMGGIGAWVGFLSPNMLIADMIFCPIAFLAVRATVAILPRFGISDTVSFKDGIPGGPFLGLVGICFIIFLFIR